ncbi:MAG TPA: hypothetical protein VKG45_12570 [Actinomycetes bacterium]|nr:hypothetical protein [Actinomycetes bacterium]
MSRGIPAAGPAVRVRVRGVTRALIALLLMVGSGLLLVALVEEGVASAEPAGAGDGTPLAASPAAGAAGEVVVSPELADLQALGVVGPVPGVGALEAGGAGQRRPDPPPAAAQLPYFWPGPRRLAVQGRPREHPGGGADDGLDDPDLLLAGIPIELTLNAGRPQELIHAGLARAMLYGLGYRQRNIFSTLIRGRVDVLDEVPSMFFLDAFTQRVIEGADIYSGADWMYAVYAARVAASAYVMHGTNLGIGYLLSRGDPAPPSRRLDILQDPGLTFIAPRNPSVVSLIAGGQIALGGWLKTRLHRDRALPYANDVPHYFENLAYDGAAHFIPAAVFMGGLDAWLRWRQGGGRIGYLQWLQESRVFRESRTWEELRLWPAWARLSPLAYGLRAGLAYATARVLSVLVTDPPPGAVGDWMRRWTQAVGQVIAAPSREAPLELAASLLLNAGYWAGLTTLEGLGNAALLVPLSVYRLGVSAGIGVAGLLGGREWAQWLAGAPGLALMGQESKVDVVVAESRMGYASRHLVRYFVPGGAAEPPPAHRPPAQEPPAPAPAPPAGQELVAQAGPQAPELRVPPVLLGDVADRVGSAPATTGSRDPRSVNPRGGTRFPDRAPSAVLAADLAVTPPPAVPAGGRRAALPPDPGFGSSSTMAGLPWWTDSEPRTQAVTPAVEQGGTAEPPVPAGDLTAAVAPRPSAPPSAVRTAGVPAGSWHIGRMEATVTGESGEQQVVVLPPLQPSDDAPPPVDASLTGQDGGEREGDGSG